MRESSRCQNCTSIDVRFRNQILPAPSLKQLSNQPPGIFLIKYFQDKNLIYYSINPNFYFIYITVLWVTLYLVRFNDLDVYVVGAVNDLDVSVVGAVNDLDVSVVGAVNDLDVSVVGAVNDLDVSVVGAVRCGGCRSVDA